MQSRIYLDYCATTPVHPRVRNKMLRALKVDYGNPSSLHWAGSDAKKLVDQARLDVAQGIGSSPDEILFTSGATEADNLALFGILRQFAPNNAHLIVSAIEHHAILHVCQQAQDEGQAEADPCFPPLRPEQQHDQHEVGPEQQGPARPGNLLEQKRCQQAHADHAPFPARLDSWKGRHIETHGRPATLCVLSTRSMRLLSTPAMGRQLTSA